MEEKIEYQASHYNDARVEIDDLDISFLGLYFNWNRLQMTDRVKEKSSGYESRLNS